MVLFSMIMVYELSDRVVFKNSIALMLLLRLLVLAIGLQGCERRSIHSHSSSPPSPDG